MILCWAIMGKLPRVGASTKSEGTERRYFYGSVWAVTTGQTVLLIVWKALPATFSVTREGSFVTLVVYVFVMALMGSLATQQSWERERERGFCFRFCALPLLTFHLTFFFFFFFFFFFWWGLLVLAVCQNGNAESPRHHAHRVPAIEAIASRSKSAAGQKKYPYPDRPVRHIDSVLYFSRILRSAAADPCPCWLHWVNLSHS